MQRRDYQDLHHGLLAPGHEISFKRYQVSREIVDLFVGVPIQHLTMKHQFVFHRYLDAFCHRDRMILTVSILKGDIEIIEMLDATR